MIVAVVIMSVFVIVCMGLAIKFNNSDDSKTAVVLMCTGLVMLVCTVSIVLSPECGRFIKSGLLGESGYEVSVGENYYTLPLPGGSVKENDLGDNVFSTKMSLKDIEKFYTELAGEENCVVIKTGGAARVSLKYEEMYFLIKVTELKKNVNQLEITVNE